jgi:SAM-dependent methyltransferase
VTSDAAIRWRERLEAWAIPQPILDAAPQSPWGFPAELFRRRATAAAAALPTLTTTRAAERLAELGTVLDVGCGGGATSTPLAGRASHVTGVDAQADMLATFETAVREAGGPNGPRVDTVLGHWPDAADRTASAEVVVCGHVVYNVPDLEPFLVALDGHAARRVVLELTEQHPLAWMNDLWERFHDVRRPDGPTDLDVAAVAQAAGIRVHLESERRRAEGATGFDRRQDAVALVRRRLCLTPERDDELGAALGPRLAERGGLWSAGPAEGTIVTLWWDVAR